MPLPSQVACRILVELVGAEEMGGAITRDAYVTATSVDGKDESEVELENDELL